MVANNRIVFNVKGNDYRLIAALHYNRGMMFIRFVGTHREHYPIEAPDPIDFLQHVMEARAMTRKDLEPFIGSRARVAEVLNRVRPLTLNMIRRLASGLKLPADVLIRGYELKRAA